MSGKINRPLRLIVPGRGKKLAESAQRWMASKRGLSVYWSHRAGVSRSVQMAMSREKEAGNRQPSFSDQAASTLAPVCLDWLEIEVLKQ